MGVVRTVVSGVAKQASCPSNNTNIAIGLCFRPERIAYVQLFPCLRYSYEFPYSGPFKYLSEPGMISFAGGYPDPEMFDVEGLREASVKAFQNSRTCLQYGGTDGSPELKAQIIRIMRSRGASAQPENVIVTTGSQQAFDLLMRVLVSAGDRVLVEQPTYTTNIQALHTYQARMTPVPIDADGLDIAALERLLANAEADADLPKLLYTVPTFGNPSGATLSLARRLRLLELAVQYRFVIVEDDPTVNCALWRTRFFITGVGKASAWCLRLDRIPRKPFKDRCARYPCRLGDCAN